MLGRIIAMVAGRSVARSLGGAGPLGAAAGLVLPTVLRRLGPGGMIVAAVGGAIVRQVLRRSTPRPGSR